MSFLSIIKNDLDRDRPAVKRWINIDSKRQINASITHFIYELIQNADDSQSSFVTITLEKDRLIFLNNGDCFNESNTRSLVSLGYSDKDEKAIGKFGVGFKSVFSVCQCPEVYSGELSFRFLGPLEIEEIESGPVVEGSQFVIPFDEDQHSVDDTFERLKSEIEEIDPLTIMFLRNVVEINWTTTDSKGTISKSVGKTTKDKTGQVVKLVKISTSQTENDFSNDSGEKHYHLVFESLVPSNKGNSESRDAYVNIVYKLSDDRKSVVRLPETKICSYFPTRISSDTSFLVQAPFDLVESRESLEEESERNLVLWNALFALFGESVKYLSSQGFVDLDFLNMMPLEDEGSEYENKFPDTFVSLFDEIPLIPTKKDGLVLCSNILIPDTPGIEDLFSKRDLGEIYESSQWVLGEIRSRKYRPFRHFLVNKISVKEVSLDDILSPESWDVSLKWLEKKPIAWFKRFYAFLLENKKLWEPPYPSIDLDERPIILSSKNKLMSPLDSNGDPNIFLPGRETVRYHTVKDQLLDDDTCNEFFNTLEITSVSKVVELKNEVISRYRSGGNKRLNLTQYKKDMREIISYYPLAEEDDRKRLLKYLRRVNILHGKNSKGRGRFIRPEDAYLDTPELRQFFSHNNDAYLVKAPFKDYERNRVFNSLMDDLGILNRPRISYFCRDRIKEYGYVFKYRITYAINFVDVIIEGIEECLINLDAKKSVVLLKFLCDFPNYWKHGIFSYYFHSKRTYNFDSYSLNILKDVAWLRDQKGDWVRPRDIRIEELHPEYDTDHTYIPHLSNILEFKPSLTASSKRLNELHELDKDLTEEEHDKLLQMASSLKEKRSSETGGGDNTGAGENFEEYTLNVIEPSLVGGNVGIIDEEESSQQDNGETTNVKSGSVEGESFSGSGTIDDGAKKERGKEAEKLLYHYFLKKYKGYKGFLESDGSFSFDFKGGSIEYIWLNKQSEREKPYDILKRENGEKVEYIEVKSKASKSQRWVEVSKQQWNKARSLYDQNKGKQYTIWVLNKIALDSNDFNGIRFNDPVKLRKKGVLKLESDSYRIQF